MLVSESCEVLVSEKRFQMGKGAKLTVSDQQLNIFGEVKYFRLILGYATLRNLDLTVLVVVFVCLFVSPFTHCCFLYLFIYTHI